jgi:hypothetical protein
MWVVTLCSDMVDPCCLYLYPENGGRRVDLKIQAACSSEMFVFHNIITRRHNPKDVDLNLHRLENVKSFMTVRMCRTASGM